MGRPSKYLPSFNKQAEKLCKLGATDKELADFFEVNEDTINDWKKKKKGFSESLKKGKAKADMEVADRLYQRAIGFKHKDTYFSQYEGAVTATPFTRYHPPDPTSMIFWLKNRRSKEWRDKQEIQLNDGRVKITVTKKKPSEDASPA